ncbi:MAG: site-specific integrase [Dehalococcoidales bacterium]|nr:site-specific integrase [Dehalococcoidales bacterium]
MPRKRNLGRGIVERKDGRLCGVLRLANGKRQYVYSHKGEKPENFADRFDALRSDTRGGFPMPPARLTVEEYLWQWMAAMQPLRAPRTVRNYETNINYFADLIGGIRLKSLSNIDVQSACTRLLTTLAPGSVHTAHMVLHAALEQAVEWKLLPRNPADKIILPNPSGEEKLTYSDEQLQQLFAATAQDRLHPLWVLMVTTGLRIGEALGLKWDDIDFAEGRLTVQRACQRTPTTLVQDETGEVRRQPGELTLRNLKTKSSRRTVYLAPGTVETLLNWRERQNQERIQGVQGMVFTSQAGTLLDPRRAQAQWVGATRKAGLPYIRPHDLRHTAATRLLRRRMHPKQVSEMLGHSSPAITMRVYAHVLESMHQEAAQLMDELFTPLRSSPSAAPGAKGQR